MITLFSEHINQKTVNRVVKNYASKSVKCDLESEVSFREEGFGLLYHASNRKAAKGEYFI